MDKEQQPQPEEQPQPTHLSHTYEDDMARAMDATDAQVVQELLANAREREAIMKEEQVKRHQRGWYTAGAIILLILALGALAYGVYHYTRLTVPAQKSLSVGVFPSTDIIVASTTDIATVLETTLADTTLTEERPYLVSLVVNENNPTLLSRQEFFSFIEATPTEPFIAAIDTVRLGVINIGKETVPFIIVSVPDPEIASKEFLIAESKLIEMMHKALHVDLATQTLQAGKGFTSEYMYNLPVRTIRYTDPLDNQERTLLLYGYTTDNTVVFTTRPEVLKAIYETIVRQR